MPLDLHSLTRHCNKTNFQRFNNRVVPQDMNCEVNAKWCGSVGSSCYFRLLWLVHYCDHALVDQYASVAYRITWRGANESQRAKQAE